MEDNQKIHPVVVEVKARPTRPLGPHDLLFLPNSDTGKGVSWVQERSHPPPIRHASSNIPLSHHYYSPNSQERSRSCFCKFICWTISLLLLLLIILAITGAILYLVFRPKLPDYSIEGLRISDLALNFDLSLYARFNVKINALNPNKKIGIYYEKESELSVWYSNTNLCQGSIPEFYQGHQNTTVIEVVLTGQSQYGSTLMKALQEQQQTGRIPLDLMVDVPVSIKLGKLKLRKVRILGTCLLNLITIKASTCKFRLDTYNGA